MNIRTTTLGTTQSMLGYISNGESKYYELSQQAASGIKVDQPSDDPIAAKQIMNITSTLDQLNGYIDNMKTSQTELNTLDDTLASLTDLIQNASDLATQAANGTYSQDDLDNIKTQIDQILNSVIDLSNTTYNGKYIFSGTAISTQTYTTDVDGNIVYNGTNTSTDAYKRYVNISDGVSVAINAAGDDIFGSYTAPIPDDPLTVGIDETAPATGTGIIGTLKLLSNALETGDSTVISSSLDSLTNNLDTVSGVRTTFASLSNKFELTESSIDATITNLTQRKSDLQDADLTEVLTDLSTQKLALEATYSVTSQLLGGLSLLDYM